MSRRVVAKILCARRTAGCSADHRDRRPERRRGISSQRALDCCRARCFAQHAAQERENRPGGYQRCPWGIGRPGWALERAAGGRLIRYAVSHVVGCQT